MFGCHRETYAALHLAGMAFCLGADDRISAVINRSLGRPDGVDSHISANPSSSAARLKLLLALLHGQEVPAFRFRPGRPSIIYLCAAYAFSPHLLGGVVASRLVDGHSRS